VQCATWGFFGTTWGEVKMSLCGMGFRVAKRKNLDYFGDPVSFSVMPLTCVGNEPFTYFISGRALVPSHHRPSSERMWTDAETLAGARIDLCDRKEDFHLKSRSWV
jgi:hypothetical protein